MGKRKIWTDGEREQLRSLYPYRSTKEVAALMNVSLNSVNGQATLLGLKKDKAYMCSLMQETSRKLSENGAAHRFGKGHRPPNKGKKWDEFMSPEAQANSLRTCFKKRHIPHNAKQDGTIIIRQRADRNEPPYKMVKVPGVRKLIFLHRHVWEEANGPIPKGYKVAFRNGDTMNCELENLELVSNADFLKRNSLHRFPEDVRMLIHTKAALTRQINEQLNNE